MKTSITLCALVVTAATSVNATTLNVYPGTQTQLENEINAARSLWTQANDTRQTLLDKQIVNWAPQDYTDFKNAMAMRDTARQQLETLTAYEGATPAQIASQPVATPVLTPTQSVPVLPQQTPPQPVAMTNLTPALQAPVLPAQKTPVKTEYVAHNDPTGIPVPPKPVLMSALTPAQQVPVLPEQKTPVKTEYVAHNDPTGTPVPPKPVLMSALTPEHQDPLPVTPEKTSPVTVQQKAATLTTANGTPVAPTASAMIADTATQQQAQANKAAIDRNATSLRAVGDAVQAQGEYVQQQSRVISHNAARIDENSVQIQRNAQRINENSKRIDETREDLKRGLNNAAAMTGLHYKSDNAWALSTGTANGEGAAMAGGIQKGITQHLNVNVQASTSFDSGWMASAGLSGDF